LKTGGRRGNRASFRLFAMQQRHDGHSIAISAGTSEDGWPLGVDVPTGGSTMVDLRYPQRYRDLEAPRSAYYADERALSRAAVAWTVMALCLAIILSIAFGIGHEPKRLAANDQASAQRFTPPAASTPILRRP
jgi:hypothetical protein